MAMLNSMAVSVFSFRIKRVYLVKVQVFTIYGNEGFCILASEYEGSALEKI